MQVVENFKIYKRTLITLGPRALS